MALPSYSCNMYFSNILTSVSVFSTWSLSFTICAYTCVCFCLLMFTACLTQHFITPLTFGSGPGSSVDIATDCGLDGPGSNPGGDEIFRPSRPGPGAHPASCKTGTRSFPGVKCGRGVLPTTHPLLVPRSWNSRAIPLPTLWATPGL